MMDEFSLQCPIPKASYDVVTLAHGGGGRLTNRLIDEVFAPFFTTDASEERHDAARLAIGGGKVAFTTDSFVVRPIFFPGGDIGTLAVNGTVNDLAMAGARPQWLSCGFILEEGVPIADVRRVVESMAAAAAEAGVAFVTGDTKVVDRGKGDGIYVNTAGIGVIEHDRVIAPSAIRPGDAIIVSGDVGRHGMAIMAVREGLEFESAIESDCAPLWSAVSRLFDAGIDVHCLRDLTRGGLTSALCELSEKTGLGINVREADIPVRDDVRGACEILGLDPMYVANEGRFVAFVAPEDASRAVEVLRGVSVSEGATVIGEVGDAGGQVTLVGMIGVERILDMLSGEQLPRIC
ncbi:MAG TPA: hydrogenase expression/formation protein HypE [Capsulimonadaceae bacterium]|jgi:hydrogenase expression/formation protein HypE